MARILVVDDDELLGETVRAILEAEGHVVGFVTSGEAAVAAIGVKQPELVILDSRMPGISGEEVLRQIRTSSSYRTPVLMLTAKRNSSDVEIAMRAGADDYLKKPFDPEELAFRVDELLESGRKGPTRL